MKMPNALVIIGHHTEEAEFGESIREWMKDAHFNFYRISHSYQNGSNGHDPSAAEIWVAEDEILKVMALHKPTVTIDVHTAEGQMAMCLAELITLHQFNRLQLVKTVESLYPVEDSMSVSVERFRPTVRDSRLQTQQRFPYTTLEMWLESNPSKIPYQTQVEFAAKVINKVSGLY
ncbi:MAG: hypothetical protein IIC69_02245 [Nanoarchaeota archaeon]|nr:hypothetical protein [Nanoarchaeota archaeon]